MKILALSSEFPPYRGGIGTYAFEMAQAAHQLGAAVTVVAPDYGDERLSVDQNGGFPVLRYRGGPHSFRDLPSKLTLVRRLLSQDRYDVVHAMDWPFFLPVALCAKPPQRRIHTLHGSDIIEMTAPLKRAAIRLSGLFAGSCEVVANSAFTRRLFLAEFPSVDPARVRFEHLGVSGFWSGAESAERRALGLPDDKFVLLTVARLTPRKGQLEVIEALRLLPPQIRARVCYAIVGPGYDEAYLRAVKAQIAEAGCDVRYFGERSNEEVRRLYKASDLFCLVGKPIPNGPIEGFGLVFLEAAAQGLPSLAGDIGGVSEVVLDGVTGVVVPVEHPTAVARDRGSRQPARAA